MVNTFITCYPLKNAIQDLNSQRLGKQRVEAQQILTALCSAHAIAKFYNLQECPSQEGIEYDIFREQWYKNVYNHYKSQKPIYRSSFGDKFSPEMTNECPKKVGFGFIHHPMTIMWIGYENGLRYYINLCILEWVSRGYKNTMNFHILFDDIPPLPWWVRSTSLHKSHISALLRKEKVRQEPQWYWNMSYMTSILNTPWYSKGYLWIGHLNRQQREILFSSPEREENYEFCAPIMNDFVDDLE